MRKMDAGEKGDKNHTLPAFRVPRAPTSQRNMPTPFMRPITVVVVLTCSVLLGAMPAEGAFGSPMLGDSGEPYANPCPDRRRSCYESDVVENGTFVETTPDDCRSLYLNGTNIGDAEAVAIAAILTRTSASKTRGVDEACLQSLYLHDNNISNIGAAAIAEALNVLKKRGNPSRLDDLYLHNNSISCSQHGSVPKDRSEVRVIRKSGICKCTGLYSGNFCETNVPGIAAIAVVFSLALVAVLIYVAIRANRKCFQPYLLTYRERRRAERMFGREHPIVVSTLAGNSYTLTDWGHCKDLKLALQKIAPELGKPNTYALLDNSGWTAAHANVYARAWWQSPDPFDAGTAAIDVDTKYGSTHRANMVRRGRGAKHGNTHGGGGGGGHVGGRGGGGGGGRGGGADLAPAECLWQWRDMGEWRAFPPASQQIINNASAKGLVTTTIVGDNARKYVIDLVGMVQYHRKTGKRPIRSIAKGHGGRAIAFTLVYKAAAGGAGAKGLATASPTPLQNNDFMMLKTETLV